MFSEKELRDIAKAAGYAGYEEVQDIATLSKKERWEIISKGEDTTKRTAAAAVEIQRIWKGYKTRSAVFGITHSRASAKSTLGDSSDCQISQLSSKTTIQSQSAVLSQKSSSRLNSSYSIHKGAALSNSNIPLPFKEFCATVIQKWWRDKLKKKGREQLLSVEKKQEDSSRQSSFDENFVRNSSVRIEYGKSSSEAKLTEDAAVSIIQRGWRRHVDMQVYRYYKDLISFKSIGDPRIMLKCINPRESDLLDSAAGGHVRFRLGGENFPPNIYYKIFTNRSIADIGAFAPRDYTKSQLKKLPMKYVHNKSDLVKDNSNVDEGDWYQRWENNGWRLVSDKMIKHLYQDPITFSTSHKKTKFHHSKLIRKEDVERKRKQKKIEWMRKMYRDGAAKEGDSNVKSLVESTAKGIIHASEGGFDLSIEDWEVDELLEWTNGLNFDQ
eukprot:gene17516-9139_t